MTEIACFWLEETGRARRYLRRFATRQGDDVPSPCPTLGYHHAMNPVDDVPCGLKKWEHGDVTIRDYQGADDLELFPRSDDRWPTVCVCGYTFRDCDRWQVFFDEIMRRGDTGEEMVLRDAPAGALWDAFGYRGSNWPTPPRPDGIHLMCKTPDGDWYVDGRANNGPRDDYGWSRSGDPRSNPPTVTAHPSIQMGGIGSSGYHGWLRNGRLVPA